MVFRCQEVSARDRDQNEVTEPDGASRPVLGLAPELARGERRDLGLGEATKADQRGRDAL
jgi:hypothetical protein